MKKRLGKFYVLSKIWEDNPEKALHAIRYLSLIPLRVECVNYKRSYEIIGISPLFREVDIGEMVPEYIITISKEDVKVEELIR